MVNHCLLKSKCGNTMAASWRKGHPSIHGKPEVYPFMQGFTSSTDEAAAFFGPSGFRINAVFLELAVECRAADAEPARDLAHLPMVMVDRQLDHLQFDIGQRAHIAA